MLNLLLPKKQWSINQFTRQPKSAAKGMSDRDQLLFPNEQYTAAEDSKGQTYLRNPRTGQITRMPKNESTDN